ncbi:MAG: anion permease [Robiginitomaculum sp.]|nr:MAG: anion permease [Robiginitomaculum sp.]
MRASAARIENSGKIPSEIRYFSNQNNNGRFLAFSAIFVVGCGILASLFASSDSSALFVTLAAMAGAYMALNIGANDVANNVSPAYGSGALTLFSAIVIAALFEASGALIAGGSVVSTISKSIIDVSMIEDVRIFVYIMMAALFAGALWLNLATWLGAPVSTTHSIVGAVMGSGIAAVGLEAVQWGVMSKIAASWVISPLLGGVIAALFLGLLERVIFSRNDLMAASRRWVPILLGIMAAAFSMYLAIKGLKKIVHLEMISVLSIGMVGFVVVSLVTRPIIRNTSIRMENHRRGVNALFTIPLIFATALLSFAHGANDVANAIGPLSAVVSALQADVITTKAAIPLWVMSIGAIGIVIGLALFGSKMIKKVGKHLTALDQSRAFCVCLSAAITVIAASALGLPVSSTHIAIGAIFGIGFYREFVINRRIRTDTKITNRKDRKLVRRRELLTIASAWLITVPAAALISAVIFRGILLVTTL